MPDSRSLRITQLTPGTGHFYCGSCLRDNALGRALRVRGHDVSMVPLYLPFVLEEAAAPELPVRMGGIEVYLQSRWPGFARLPGLVRRVLNSPSVLRFSSRHGEMTRPEELGDLTLSMLRGEEGRLRHEVEKLCDSLRLEPRPDVLVLSNLLLVGVARALRDAVGVPVVCTLQGEAPFLDELPPEHRAEAWRLVEARSRDVAAFLAVSRSYARTLQQRMALDDERIHVVHNGIPLDDFPAQFEFRDPAPPVVGYLARLCREKGLPTLVDAFLLLRQRPGLERVQLRVAGVQLKADRALVRELQARIERAGAAGSVEFRVNIERSAKLDFLRGLSVLSVPATYGESFGLYLLEALAMGVPVVQPRHGSFEEVLAATGGGRLCRPDDPEDLACELEALLREPEERRGLAARGHAGVHANFGSHHMAERVEVVLHQILAEVSHGV